MGSFDEKEPIQPTNPSGGFTSSIRRFFTGDTELDTVNDSIYNADLQRWGDEMNTIYNYKKSTQDAKDKLELDTKNAEIRAKSEAEDEAAMVQIRGAEAHKQHLEKLRLAEIAKVKKAAAERAAASGGSYIDSAGQNVQTGTPIYPRGKKKGGVRSKRMSGGMKPASMYKAGEFLSPPSSYNLDKD